ncbi:MAG: T9SS type A sorting domain-containing protein [Rhodothermales bacterium]|nr:T9SS type A sorting domain-containing protein [Rhodothermales bacterium]
MRSTNTALRKCVLAVFAALMLAGEAQSQTFEINSSDPVNGSANVALTKRVEFQASRPLWPFGTAFVPKFHWSPEDSTRLTVFGHATDANGSLTIAFFTLTHRVNTDFSFFVYGLRAYDRSVMSRPFVLNYTTAPEAGANVVSGTVTVTQRSFAKAEPSQAEVGLRHAIGNLLRANQAAIIGSSGQGAEAGDLPKAAVAEVAYRAALESQAIDPTKSVILLLDSYGRDQGEWTVKSAATVDEAGNYQFDHVRDGTYWPLAINFADEDGELIGAYGFYDADADYTPDPINVSDGDVSGLTITMLPLSRASAFAYEDVARERARQFFPDQRLIEMTASSDTSDGTAPGWSYTYYSPSGNLRTVVDIDPINVLTRSEAAKASDASRAEIPATAIDSEAALQFADQAGGGTYREGLSPFTVPMSFAAGDLDIPVRPPPSRVFWKVTYLHPFEPKARLDFYVDIETGEILSAVPVSNDEEAVLPQQMHLTDVYPNPFYDTVTIGYAVGSPGEVQLAVFDLLGRQVAELKSDFLSAGKYSASWNAEAHNSGMYVVRLQGTVRSEVRTVVLLK